MSPIQYVGEHLWIHYSGHFLVLLAFFSALFGITAYAGNRKQLNSAWKTAIRLSFITHALSILGIILLIFFMMSRHYYEYEYVWGHVSDELPSKYILSAFWEGQEGSFLLWMFWNLVLGAFFIRLRNPNTTVVLTTILGVNAILTAMLLGIYIGDSRIGSSPFNLLRHTMDIPLFNNAEYTSLLKGNGLNPLLQNYWMIIHPPTLFLGFASTIIPFGYGLAALINKDYSQWLKPVLPWALFSGGVLGAGILMGAAWAYEALSFGGYWAWDPVENMSLVPWIVLVAGIHTNLIARSTGYSITPTLVFYFLSFILVVYSSFLTRSGILGDSSAHAFTQMGLEWQLVIFCLLVTAIPGYLFLERYKTIPRKEQEETLNSREFWMFIGSLVLLFSAVLISFTTSIPVYNKLLDLLGSIIGSNMESYHRSTPLDPVSHHNQYQLWIAVLVAVLSATSLFMKYLGDRKTPWASRFYWSIGISLGASLLATWFSHKGFEKLHWSHGLLLWSAWFSLACTLTYLVHAVKFQGRQLAPVLSHGGFAILLLGVLFTGINKHILSSNRFAQEGLVENWSEDDLSKHLTLIKNQKMWMNGYWVEYTRDTFISKSRIYDLAFWKEDSSGVKTDSFVLKPEVQYDNKLTKVAASNPSTRHYFNKDIFSLIAQIPVTQTDVESAQKAEDSLRYELYFCKLNDTLFTKKHFLVLKGFEQSFPSTDFGFMSGDQKLRMLFEVRKFNEDSAKLATPSIVFRNRLVFRFPHQLDAYEMRLQIPDTLYSKMVPNPDQLRYHRIALKQGEEMEIGPAKKIKLIGFTKDLDPEVLVPGKNEIALAALLEYRDKNYLDTLRPIYYIRDNQVISSPYSSILPGMTVRFMKINPDTEVMEFDYALHPELDELTFPVEIAENAARNDFIVIQVIEFPWISLVWTGGIMLLFGMLLAAYFRLKQISHVA